MADRSASWRSVAEDCRRLTSPAERERTRRFLLEGYRLHERAVRAGACVEIVLIGRSAGAAHSPRMQELKVALAAAGTLLVEAPDEVLDELTAGRGGGPLVGIAPMPPDAGPSVGTGTGSFLVAADVEDPGNVGAMMRTALAAGCNRFIATGISDPFHPKAVRTSMGSLFRIPVSRIGDSLSAVAMLKQAGVFCVGALSRGGTPLHQAGSLWKGKDTALFLGSEARGLPEPVVDGLDAVVTIPMVEDVDSFSVNAAAAIVLYERFRNSGTGT